MTPSRRSLPTLCAAGLGLAALSATATAQAFVSIDTAGNIDGFAGPAAGACSYPNGGLHSQAGYVTGAPCYPIENPVPGLPSLVGDIATDLYSNTLWITDGLKVVEYDSPNTPFNGFEATPGVYLQGAITGLGYDSATWTLWMTDGTQATAVQTVDCLTPPTVTVSAFDLPLATGATATDIDWDPHTGTLWICDDLGFVTNVNLDGTVGSYPPFVPAASVTGTLFGPDLHGLAVDRAAQNPGILFVTDGSLVYHVDAGAQTGAPSTIYSSVDLWDMPSDTHVMGLAMNAHAISFGKPSGGHNPFPFPFKGFPVIGAKGNATVGNAAYEIGIAGARDGEIGALFLAGDTFCPGIPVDAAEVLINLAFSYQYATFVASPDGLADIPLPLPASLAPGITLYAQAFLVELDFATPKYGVSSTAGLAFTTALR